MDVRQLEQFLVTADELNFTRAAARVRVTQSALSYQIARLERELRSTLFDRSSRAVRLTPAGELLVPRATAIIAESERARADLAALSGVVSGRLRIGMIGSTSTAVPVVEQSLAHFHQAHPGVEIAIGDVGSRRMVDEVINGTVDVAFVGLFAEQVPNDLAHRTLAIEPLVAVTDGPLVGGTSISVAELAARGPMIEMRSESGVRRQVDEMFGRAGVTRQVAFELSTSEAVVRFVGLGFGSAVVPRSATLGRDDVSVLDLDDSLALHPVGLIHRRPQPAAPAARVFVEMVLDNVGFARPPA